MPRLWDRVGKFFRFSDGSLVAPDEKILTEQMAPQGGAWGGSVLTTPAGVTPPQNDPRRLFGGNWGMNPAIFNQAVLPVRYNSSALGIVYGRNLQFYDLMDQMVDDDTTIAGIEADIDAFIGGFDEQFIADEKNDRAKEIASEVSDRLTGVQGAFGWKQMRRALRCGAWRHGFSVVELVWAREDGMIVPVAYKHVHPGFCAFNVSGELVLFPAPYDGNNPNPEPVPPYKFVVMRYNALYANPYGDSQLAGLRWIYQAKKLALKGWITYTEKYGTPILVVSVPETVQNKAQAIADAKNVLENLDVATGAVFGRGEVVTAVQRTSSGTQSPQAAFVQWCDGEMVRRGKGGTLDTMQNQQGSGSFAQSKTHQQTTHMRMTLPAEMESDVITNQIVDPFCMMNYAEIANGSVDAPVYKIDTEVEQDLKANIDSLTEGVALGLTIKQSQARDMLGLEIPGPDDDVVVPRPLPQQVPSPAAPVAAGAQPPASTPEAGQADQKKKPDEPVKFSDRVYGSCPICGAPGVMRERRKNGNDECANGHIYPSKYSIKHRIGKPDEPVKFAEADPEVERAIFFRELATEVAAQLASANRPTIEAAVVAALDRVRSHYAAGQTLSMGAVGVAAFETPELAKELLQGVLSARGLAALDTMIAAKDYIPGAVIPNPSAIDPYYAKATEWMVSRDVATVAQVKDMAAALSLLDPTADATALELEMRSEVLALAQAPSLEITRRFQEWIAQAVGEGQTVGEFLTQADALVEAGELPAGMDSYLTLVFNQEITNAYGAQRAATASDPLVAPYVWGREMHNAKLPDSRPTHIALDGLLLRKGSAADQALGDEPFSFNCTCTSILLMDPNPAAVTKWVEPANAEKIVSQVERFGTKGQ